MFSERNSEALNAPVEYLSWSKARADQFPDHVVRGPLANPPP